MPRGSTPSTTVTRRPRHLHTLQPGLLLLSRPGLRESYAWDPDQACVHAYVTFYLDESGPLGAPDGWPLIRSLSPADPLAALCRYLLWLGGTDSAGARARTPEVLGWLLDLFVNGPVGDEGDEVLPEHIVRLVDHLRATWRDGGARALRLEEMASAARVSPGHLARHVPATVRSGSRQRGRTDPARPGRHPAGAQQPQRRARFPRSCGFVNPFHFSRRFRAAYGAGARARTAPPRPQDPLDPVRRAGLLALAQRLWSRTSDIRGRPGRPSRRGGGRPGPRRRVARRLSRWWLAGEARPRGRPATRAARRVRFRCRPGTALRPGAGRDRAGAGRS